MRKRVNSYRPENSFTRLRVGLVLSEQKFLTALGEHLQLNPAFRIRFVMHLVRRFNEILGGRLEDVVNVLLRIAVNQRKPGTLNMDHDSMAPFECMTNVLQW